MHLHAGWVTRVTCCHAEVSTLYPRGFSGCLSLSFYNSRHLFPDLGESRLQIEAHSEKLYALLGLRNGHDCTVTREAVLTEQVQITQVVLETRRLLGKELAQVVLSLEILAGHPAVLRSVIQSPQSM